MWSRTVAWQLVDADAFWPPLLTGCRFSLWTSFWTLFWTLFLRSLLLQAYFIKLFRPAVLDTWTSGTGSIAVTWSKVLLRWPSLWPDSTFLSSQPSSHLADVFHRCSVEATIHLQQRLLLHSLGHGTPLLNHAAPPAFPQMRPSTELITTLKNSRLLLHPGIP